MVAADALATELLDALDHAHLLIPFTDRDPAFSVEAAYRVRAEVTRRRRARGETPIGLKLGFTWHDSEQRLSARDASRPSARADRRPTRAHPHP